MKEIILKYFSCLIFLLPFFIFISSGCRRIEVVKNPLNIRSEVFFKTSKPVSSKIKNVIEKLKAENIKTEFVDKLQDKIGIPIWDKMIFTKDKKIQSRGVSDSLEKFIIPLTVNDKSLSSIINIKELTNGNLSVQNYTSNDYLYKKVYELNANIEKIEELFILFFYMENKTFGNNEFYNIPPKYFIGINHVDRNGNKIINIKYITPSTDNYVMLCSPIFHLCNVCFEYSCPLTTYTISCSSYWDGNFDDGGGGGSGTGGSGGGSPPPIQKCPGTA